jgi:hypothetical protein
MFIVTWLFDKIGYMPKISVDTSWPFPAVQKPYTPHEFETPVAKKTTKVAKKTTVKAVKIPKATTRTSKPKK